MNEHARRLWAVRINRAAEYKRVVARLAEEPHDKAVGNAIAYGLELAARCLKEDRSPLELIRQLPRDRKQ